MNRIYEHKTPYYALRDQIEQDEEKSKEIHKHTIKPNIFMLLQQCA